MPGTRARDRGQPDRIYNLLATLNQEQEREKHDIYGAYQGRLRSHAQNFEGMKRKWEGITGVPAPKKLRTSEPDDLPVVRKEGVGIQNLAAKTAVKKAKANNSAALPTKLPPHPNDKVNIDKLLVSDLRRELRKRGLVTSGRKAELQARLRECLAEAKQKREVEWAARRRAAAAPVAAKKKEAEMTQIKQVQISDGTNHTGQGCGQHKVVIDVIDVDMEDASEADASVRNGSEKSETAALAKMAPEALVENMASGKAKHAPMESEPVAEEGTKPPAAVNKLAPKSALKPSKYTHSPSVQNTPQLDDAKPAVAPAPTSLQKEDLPAHRHLIPNKVSDSSTESSYPVSVTASASNPSAKSTKLLSSAQKIPVSSTLAQTTPAGSAFKTKKVAGNGSAKLQQKKKAHSAATEARKARLAEMRQKAKPTVANASSSAKTPSSNSKYAVSSTLKKMASNSAQSETKTNSILAKMREKAVAEKGTENTVFAPPSKATKATKSTAMTSSSATNKHNAQHVTQAATTTFQPATKSSSMALKSILDPANKLQVVTKPPAKLSLKKPEETPLSPMQTYEMSDREEESDSDSESEEEYENQRPKKAVPGWAQKVNLHRALERQFADGPDRLDPDKIFGEVLTCNLEEIFDKKKSRYQRRTSSGNWAKDHVTLAEKLTYKRTMNYM